MNTNQTKAFFTGETAEETERFLTAKWREFKILQTDQVTEVTEYNQEFTEKDLSADHADMRGLDASASATICEIRGESDRQFLTANDR